MEAYRRANLFGQLLDVTRIPVRNDHVAHLVAVCCHRFLLEPANRQHSSAERDLAGHRDIAAHGYAGEGADHRRGDGDSGRGPVLRRCTGWHVDVDVARAVEIGLDAKGPRAGPRIRQRRACRLLHHVSEGARELHLAASAHDAHLDLEHLAAYLGVGETRSDTDLVLERCVIGVERRRAEKLVEVRDAHGLHTAIRHHLRLFRPLARELARNARYPALQLPYTGFTGVPAHDGSEHVWL